MNSRKIGRIKLYKYCLLTVFVWLGIPVIMWLGGQLFSDSADNNATIYKNLMEYIDGELGLIISNIIVIGLSVWFIGGLIGKLILERKRNHFLVGFLSIFLLWIILLLSCAISAGIKTSITQGAEAFMSPFLTILIYGGYLTLLAGVINGIIFGFILGWEISKHKTSS